MVDIINQYPDGITTRQIAERIWRDWGHDSPPERWCVRSVENRLNQAIFNAKQYRTQVPFDWRYEQEGNFKRKFYLPAGAPVT